MKWMKINTSIDLITFINIKLKFLKKMEFNAKEIKHYLKVLNEYKYVDEIDELVVGRYLRWFNLNHIDNMKLNND